jgi:hypothetical protein
VATRGSITDEAVRVAATDGVEVETAVKSGKVLLARRLSYTEVSQTLAKA